MGYDTDRITIHLTLSRHNSEQDAKDNEAAAKLREEIGMLIYSDSDYSRIAQIGWVG